MVNGTQFGLSGAESALAGGLTGAGAILDPFARGGAGAFNLQSALTGAAGPQAQQTAFANFRRSPGQQFLQTEAERALLRNQGAIGGLGGGNVRRALQEQAVGLAQQDFGNQFSRLGQVAGFGGQAAGNLANLAFGTGQSVAGARERAGTQIAQNIGQTTSALANLASQQGTGLSDLIGQGGGNLANLLSGAGTAQGLSTQQLATLLANIATGTGSQVAGLPSLPGVQQTPSNLSNIGNLLSGIGTLF